MAATPAPDGAIVANSGSTNAGAYTIALTSDGSARANVPGGATAERTLPAELTARFFHDVRAARDAAEPARGCMKSASFGSRTQVQWHGWSSPDLLCPQQGQTLLALAADVRQIEAALGIAPGIRRRIPLPLEPRKIPVEAPEPEPTT